jgi:hypothetical protein
MDRYFWAILNVHTFAPAGIENFERVIKSLREKPDLMRVLWLHSQSRQSVAPN